MLLLRTERLPPGRAHWAYELKLDGYRAIAFKAGRASVQLRSRNDHDYRRQYPGVVRGLAKLPADTIIDGEIVAFDDDGRPSFQRLQNYGAAPGAVFFFGFDVLMLRGRDVMREPLSARRALLEQEVLPTLAEPVRYLAPLDADLATLLRSVREQGLEGLIAKRLDSAYEPGERSGAWLKMRVNQSQEMVIAGYTIGAPFDALVFGYYDDEGRLLYAGRTRARRKRRARCVMSCRCSGRTVVSERVFNAKRRTLRTNRGEGVSLPSDYEQKQGVDGGFRSL